MRLKTSREAAKKIVDLMIKHGAEQNAVLVICATCLSATTRACESGMPVKDPSFTGVSLFPVHETLKLYARDLAGTTAARYLQTIV